MAPLSFIIPFDVPFLYILGNTWKDSFHPSFFQLALFIQQHFEVKVKLNKSLQALPNSHSTGLAKWT